MPRSFKSAKKEQAIQFTEYCVEKIKNIAVFGSMSQGALHDNAVPFERSIVPQAHETFELVKGKHFLRFMTSHLSIPDFV